MYCPNCNSYQNGVVDSRPQANGTIKRVRKCLDCNYRFKTVETVQTDIGADGICHRPERKDENAM